MNFNTKWLPVMLLIVLTCIACSQNNDSAKTDGDIISDGDIDSETDGDAEPELDSDESEGDTFDAEEESEPESTLAWLHARSGEHPGIFDDDGRQWLLRGVNFNHLGDYWQVHPSLPTVAELTDEDWDDVAFYGTNVIRLVTTWSFWQPERDSFNEEYLKRVQDAIKEANKRNMYVVIDMHQDAWSKFVFTPADEVCPEGTTHQKGWDGAPKWATFTDDKPTCTPGRREESPAVIRAWTNFYDNREGIMDELVGVWTRIAKEFAHHSGVAGFDLLNEPGEGKDNTLDGLTEFYRKAIDAIREAEAEVGGRGHIIIFEPTAHAILPHFDLHDDPQLVFGAHNYFGMIHSSEDLLEDSFGLYAWLAEQYGGRTVWIGEYGAFGDEERNTAYMTKYAALEDSIPGSGGAWWQWAQRCGDPHNVEQPPSEEWLEEKQALCDDKSYTRRYSDPPAKCMDRAFPRAVPGRLIGIGEGACDGNLVVTGETDTSGEADLWYPSASETEPDVSGENIESVTLNKVPGGWRITATVSGLYSITVNMQLK